MAYNTKSIVKDVNQKPIPQYYNIDLDIYEVQEGHNGASKVILYDKDGNEVDLKELLTQIYTLLLSISGMLDIPINDLYDKLNEIDNKDPTKTLYGLSTDTKPTTNMIVGNKYFEIDTTEAYMWDGTSWVVI